MRDLDLVKLESVLRLIDKYNIDEIQCEEYTIKKSRFKTPEPTDKQILDRHTLDHARNIAATRITEVEGWLEGKE
jgi:hypothetical protein